jgi:hypothetical protein
MCIPASVCAFLFAALLFAAPSHAQKVELFGGYSFVRAPVTLTPGILCPVPGCPATFGTQHLNFHGWEASGAVKLLGPLALAADFSDTSSSYLGLNTHLKTYLLGPQVRFPGPISPFAHFLVGAAHESIGGATQDAFSAAVGVGMDIKVLPFISIRPIQVDYLLTHFHSATQNQPRVSAGLVVHF